MYNQADVIVTVDSTSLGTPNTGVNFIEDVAPAAGSLALVLIFAIILIKFAPKLLTLSVSKKSLGLLGFFTFALIGGFLVASVFQSPASSQDIDQATLVSDPSLALAEQIGNVEMTLNQANAYESTGSHVLKVQTNSPDGYTIAIQSAASETALTSASSSDTIAALESAGALTDNTWGYALDTTGTYTGLADSAVTFYTATGPNYDADPLTVYFGAKVSGIADGTYENTVLYTITSSTDLSSIPAPVIDSITPAFGSVVGGDTITLVGDNFTQNGESITTSVLVGGEPCTDVSVTHDSTTGKDTITCTTPATTTEGTVTVEVITWGGSDTTSYEYDTSDIVYVTPNIASTVAGSDSGPTFTIYGDGFVDEDNPVVAAYIGTGRACDSFVVVSNTQITCTAGPNGGGSSVAGEQTVYVVHQNGAVSTNHDVKVTYYDTDYPTTSDLATTCTTTKTIARDERDSQLYYVRQLADGKCWLVDNLRYNGGTLSQVSGKYLTTSGSASATDGTLNDVAKYVDPGTLSYCMNDTNMPSETVTRCGFLYNWYAANAGSVDSSTNVSGVNAQGSICPDGFRLPSSYAGTGGPTYDTDLLDFFIEDYSRRVTYSLTADFPIANASMFAGYAVEGLTSDIGQNWYSNWAPDGAFSSVYAGTWTNNFANTGNNAYYWSSTTATKVLNGVTQRYRALPLEVQRTKSKVFTGDGSYNDQRYIGHAVRCVAE